MMRKLLLGAAAILAVSATAGVAAADTSTIGVHAGNLEGDSGDDVDFWGLSGGWNHDFSNGWAIQADGEWDRVDIGTETGSSYGAIALGTRNDAYSLYGFAGLSDTLASSGISYGIGGEFYVSNFVFGASLGHTDLEQAILPEADLTSLDLDATWFFTPNFGVSGQLGWSEAEVFTSDVDWESYGVGAVWRFAGSPISLTGRYRHDEFDGGEVDGWRLGVNFNFGTDTAQEQATRGPSWAGARNLYEDSYVFLP